MLNEITKVPATNKKQQVTSTSSATTYQSMISYDIHKHKDMICIESRKVQTDPGNHSIDPLRGGLQVLDPQYLRPWSFECFCLSSSGPSQSIGYRRVTVKPWLENEFWTRMWRPVQLLQGLSRRTRCPINAVLVIFSNKPWAKPVVWGLDSMTMRAYTAHPKLTTSGEIGGSSTDGPKQGWQQPWFAGKLHHAQYFWNWTFERFWRNHVKPEPMK